MCRDEQALRFRIVKTAARHRGRTIVLLVMASLSSRICAAEVPPLIMPMFSTTPSPGVLSAPPTPMASPVAGMPPTFNPPVIASPTGVSVDLCEGIDAEHSSDAAGLVDCLGADEFGTREAAQARLIALLEQAYDATDYPVHEFMTQIDTKEFLERVEYHLLKLPAPDPEILRRARAVAQSVKSGAAFGDYAREAVRPAALKSNIRNNVGARWLQNHALGIEALVARGSALAAAFTATYEDDADYIYAYPYLVESYDFQASAYGPFESYSAPTPGGDVEVLRSHFALLTDRTSGGTGYRLYCKNYKGAKPGEFDIALINEATFTLEDVYPRQVLLSVVLLGELRPSILRSSQSPIRFTVHAAFAEPADAGRPENLYTPVNEMWATLKLTATLFGQPDESGPGPVYPGELSDFYNYLTSPYHLQDQWEAGYRPDDAQIHDANDALLPQADWPLLNWMTHWGIQLTGWQKKLPFAR